MKPDQIKGKLIDDMEDALALLRSPEWKHYVNFLKDRGAKLQLKVNAAIRSGDLVEAKINLALLEDGLKQANLFKRFCLETNAKLKKEGTENA